MSTTDSYQIASTTGTTTSLLQTAPSVTVPALKEGVTPNYSTVIGSGGSTGGGWPFQDFNMMNDPEGNMAALPAIYIDGTGGPAGDPEAFQPNTNDEALAGYANVGANWTAADGVNLDLSDSSYIQAATDLNNSNVTAAYAVGFAQLTDDAGLIPWTKIVGDATPNIGKGVAELAGSSGLLCGAAVALGNASLQIAGRVIAMTAAVAPEGLVPVTAFEGAQLFVATAGIINKCGLAAFGPSMDSDEAYVLGLIYDNDFKGYEHRPGGPGVDGGDALHAFSPGTGSAPTLKAPAGVNFLTSAYDGQTGTAIVLKQG